MTQAEVMAIITSAYTDILTGTGDEKLNSDVVVSGRHALGRMLDAADAGRAYAAAIDAAQAHVAMHASAVIPNADDYDRVTGEHPVIRMGGRSLYDKWADHYDTCDFCRAGNFCPTGRNLVIRWGRMLDANLAQVVGVTKIY